MSTIGGMELDRNGLQVLTRTECLDLLRTAVIGRVGCSSGALPTVLPVNFVVDGESVVIRTTSGSKLEAATRHAVVAFEADEIDPVYHGGWSVVLTGVASAITDEAELDRVRHLPLNPWGVAHDGVYVRISAELVSGRRLGALSHVAAANRGH